VVVDGGLGDPQPTGQVSHAGAVVAAFVELPNRSGWPSTAPWTACSRRSTKLDTLDSRAIDKLECLVRGSVHVLVEQLPFVTLLLRVRGNTKVERDALARRREFDRVVADLVSTAADGDLRADINPATAERLLFGMVNSITEWYRPKGSVAASQLADMVAAMAFHGLRVRPEIERT
jgi:hypothetical protein